MIVEKRPVSLSARFVALSFLVLALALGMAVPIYAQNEADVRESAVSPEKLSDAFAEVAKKVGPAVVSIDAKSRTRESARGEASPDDADDLLEFFRRQIPRRSATAIGSGFIVDKSGYILTNAHVIEDAAKVTVRLDSGEELAAEIIGSDEETDIAVLKVNAGRDLPAVKFGNSENARVGDWVLAIGSPFGLNRTVTAGIISQTKRETPYATPFQKFIQTDAAINRGNSGGPLVNLNGEVIGVNSQIATSTGDYNGVGFALPSTEAEQVYKQLLTDGKVRRGYLGILLDSVKAEYAKVYEMDDERGAIVVDVRDNDGPAAAAGLKAGDVIVEFDGQAVVNAQDLIAKVASTPPDRSVNVIYLREVGKDIERRSVSMRLGERPPNARGGTRNTPSRLPLERDKPDSRPFGLTLSNVTPALAASLKLEGKGGVEVKEINPESFIADVKLSSGADALRQGDIIIRVNRKPVADQASFTAIVRELKKGDAVVMHVLTPVPGNRATELKIVQFSVQD